MSVRSKCPGRATSAAALLSLVLSSAWAAGPEQELESVVVTATRVPYQEVEATYAAEVHTRGMIENSGARTLADYLGQHTSLTVMPYYGNRLTPTLEMRGYGLETGNQNVVVTLDGQRLNSIDLQPQLLGAIPLASIDRIEITKGSGAVMQGDGAMAGTINIITRPYTGVTAEARIGDHGAASISAAAGIERDTFSLHVGADHDTFGGVAHADSSGKKDRSLLRTEGVRARFRPLHTLELKLDISSAHTDTRFQNPLTLAQFEADPSQNGGATIYTNYISEVDRWRIGAEVALFANLRLTADHRRMNQQNLSAAWWGSFSAGYDTQGDDIALTYTGDAFDLTAGWQQADASRTQTASRTAKDNSGYYAQGTYRWNDTGFSFGARREKVEYAYLPSAGTAMRGSHELDAWDLGVNHRLDARWTAFANLNQSFQAPDVDRFFTFAGAFNGLIVPAEARTLTAGVHRVAGRGDKFKLSVFRANLANEIYYHPTGPWSGDNTNIDKSHKYGLEIQQYWQPAAAWSLDASYVWTRALIDREDSGAGAYDGKTMPGVPRHAVNLAMRHAIDAATELTLTHAWRSSSYAISDFDNDNAQRQRAFSVTNLGLRYRRGTVDYFATINNLFARKNGMWTADDTIYPVNYARSMAVGARVKF